MKYREIWTESLNNTFNNYVKYIISETRTKKPIFRSIFSLSNEITSRLTSNREEKSLRHVAMDAKFLDDDKPKTSVKVSDFIDLILLHLLCQMLANFSGIESERTVSKFRKRKSFCAVFTYFIKRSREIRKFHVAVVQRRLRNVQKSVIVVEICCFAYLNLLLFCFCCCHRRRSYFRAPLLSSRNFATMLTWLHTSPLHCSA